MIKNIYVTCALFFFVCLGAYAQTGSIKGKILDKATKEPIPFATVVAETNGQQAGGAQSDFDGEFNIKPLQAGKYTVKVKFIGYNDIVVNDVLVSVDKITFQDLALSKQAVDLKPVEVIEYKVPLIDKGNPSVTTTITREEIEAAPTRDVRAVAATAAGVLQKDEGDDVNVRGTRSEATDYYVDGIKIRGSKRLPQAGVEQVTVVTGGLPSQYGDATGGVISITTRGPSQEFAGGIELVTSELFDKYGYNLASLNLSGPLLKKKQSDGSSRTTMGFFLSGEFQHERDPDPSAIGVYKLKDDVYNDLKANPVNPSLNSSTGGAGAWGFSSKPEYYKADAFEKSKTKNNTGQTGYRFTLKLDLQPSPNTTFTLGGNYDFQNRRSFDANFDPQAFLRRSMYNFNENPQIKETNYRAFARITQKLGSTFSSQDNKSASLIKNVYISLQGEYSKNATRNQDAQNKDNLWAYGYYGEYKNTRTKHYKSLDVDTNYLTNPVDSFELDFYTNHYSYTPGGNNELSTIYTVSALNYINSIEASNNYTQDSLIGVWGQNSVSDLLVIKNAGGLRNGDGPGPVFSMWDNIGAQRNVYINENNDAYRITLNGNADIKNHALSIGFEFEQQINRSFRPVPRGFWTVGRQLANVGYLAVDRTQPLNPEVVNGITYFDFGSSFTSSTFEGNQIESFSERLRKKLGQDLNSYVDFDALTPDQLSMDLFTPDELLTNNLLLYYYGYDYTGKKFDGNPTFKDFFTKKENNLYTREIGAFRPIYMAGYIQDKFAIDNLIFNIGVRIDRFDANQKQLRDKYLMSESYTVGNLPGGIPNKPGNIGDDFVPYLEVENDFTKVAGYRDGDVWYDKEGRVVSNPDFIAQTTSSGRLFAAAVNPNARNDFATSRWEIDRVFKDYEPQYSIMPRVAFSFPISDQAIFFAHYDVLTQRPTTNLSPDPLRLDPTEYFTLATNANSVGTGGLKPEKTTDYELGFKQTLSKSSALSLSAFYREMRNNIQVRKLGYAYPFGYTTYDNIDFGTVKGLTIAYDLRRTNNVRLSASYTLQFADGTGSGAQTNLELTQTDNPDIRIIFPLDFDQRHNFVSSIDYRYETGSNYNGPILFGKQFFAGMGANFTFKVNSGTPYTRQSRPTQEANAIGWQDNGQRAVEGGLNGGRTPWQFRADLKINKDFALKLGSKKTADIQIYIQIQNLFDTRNVVNVYRVTGNPDDDGYLNSVDGVAATNSQNDPQAFADQYRIKVNNPSNYSIPRRMRLGVAFNF